MLDYICDLQNRDLDTLKDAKSSLTSYEINRFDHSLQTASFEARDGADIKLIFAALFHDVGNALKPENHPQVSATIIQPFSLDEVTLFLQMHSPFQMYYYVAKFGLEKDDRDFYSQHKLFNAAVKFGQKMEPVTFCS